MPSKKVLAILVGAVIVMSTLLSSAALATTRRSMEKRQFVHRVHISSKKTALNESPVPDEKMPVPSDAVAAAAYASPSMFEFTVTGDTAFLAHLNPAINPACTWQTTVSVQANNCSYTCMLMPLQNPQNKAGAAIHPWSGTSDAPRVWNRGTGIGFSMPGWGGAYSGVGGKTTIFSRTVGPTGNTSDSVNLQWKAQIDYGTPPGTYTADYAVVCNPVFH